MNSILLATLNSKYIHSSLSLKYLQAMLKDDMETGIAEYTINETVQDIIEDIIRKGYDTVAFSCYIWNIEQTLRIADTVKKIEPRTNILLGGPEVSFDSVELLRVNSFVDFIIRGEGEIAIKEFGEFLRRMRKIEEVSNLTYRKDGEIRENPLAPLIEDFSIIPPVYMDGEKEDFLNKIVYYEASRGCTYRCAYCLSSISKGVRFFPRERVESELYYLVQLGVKQIKFVDRTFNYNKDYLMHMLRYLISIDDGSINFHFEITASLLDDEAIEILNGVRKGLFQFEIGVQSTNDITLKEVFRPNHFDRIKEIVRKIQRGKNIHQHLDLIAGLPFETLAEFQTSFSEVFDLQVEMLQLGFLKVLKGTPMCDLIQKHGIEYSSYPPYEVLKTKYLSYADLSFLKKIEHLVDRYYNSRKYSALMRLLYFERYPQRGFQLFSELYTFQEMNGRKNQSSSEESDLLYQFAKEVWGEDENFLLRDCVRFDTMMMGRKKKLSSELSDLTSLSKEEQEFIFDCLKEEDVLLSLGFDPSQSAKNIFKKVGACFLNYDLVSYLEGDGLKRKDMTVIVNYEREREFSELFPYVVIERGERVGNK